MALQDYDSYAIKTYSFAIHKTNSFFSLPTLLLSATILTAALLLNLNTLSHLWLPLADLNIRYTQTLELPQPLTNTIVCVKPHSTANLGLFKFMRADLKEILFPHIPQTQIQLQFPHLHQQIGGPYECVDLADFAFQSSKDRLYMHAFDPNATMYVQGVSFNSVVNNQKDDPMVLRSVLPDKTSCLYVTIIKFTIQDSLFIGTTPKTINTFRYHITNDPIYNDKVPSLNYDSNGTTLALQIYTPYAYQPNTEYHYNIFNYTITRFNIAYILGAVLSWVSILALAVGLVAAPLMDKKLALLTAQTLFNAQQYNKPSLLRFAIASLKKGLFPNEDRFVRMCEQLQNMKDVNAIVKLQLLLARLSPKTNKISAQEPIAAQHSFNTIVRSDCAVPSFRPQSDSFRLQSEQKESVVCKSRGRVGFDASVQLKQVPCWVSVRRSLLHFLDSGSDSVSVTYQKGGIGSKSSLLLTLTIGFSLLAFLYISGMLSLSSSTNVALTLHSDVSYNLGANQLLLVASQQPLPKLSVFDGNNAKVQDVQATYGSDCITTVNQPQRSAILSAASDLSLILCVQSAHLRLSANSSLTRNLFINMSEVSSTAWVQAYQLKTHDSYAQYKPIDVRASQMYGYQSAFMYQTITVKLTTINNGKDTVTLAQFLQASQPSLSCFQNYINGVIVQLLTEVNQITVDSLSFYDIVQNVWSFTIICFTILIMKLTKYINLQQKQQRLSVERTEFRDSICIVLSRMHGLRNGRNGKELSQLRFYTKEQLTSQ